MSQMIMIFFKDEALFAWTDSPINYVEPGGLDGIALTKVEK